MVLEPAARAHVPGVSANHPFRAWGKPLAVSGTAKVIAGAVPEDGWQRLSAGDGTKGAGLHDWVHVDLADFEADFDATFPGIGMRGLLIRRNIAGDLAFFFTRCPTGTSIEKQAGGDAGTSPGNRGKLRDRQERTRPRSQRNPLLAWLASPCLAGHTRLGHDGDDPPSCQCRTAPENDAQLPSPP